MVPEVDNIIPLSTTLHDFFKKWLEFSRPLHNLTEREQDVVAAFLRHRHILMKKISDPKIVEQVLFSEQTKKDIMKEENLSVAHFQVIMGKLRKAGIINNNTLNPRIIPLLKENSGGFKLLIYFDILENESE